MPALPDAANILKIVLSGTFGTATWANVMHAKWFGTTPSNSDLTTLAGSIATLYDAQFGAQLADDLILTQCQLTDLTSTSAARGTWTGSLAGAETQDILPANAAAVISWGIARRYRGGHCRTYLAGLTVNARVSATHLTATKITNLANAAATFRNSVNALTTGPITSLELGQLSYYTAGALRVTPLFDPIISLTVNGRIDSQRRRLGV